MRSSTTFRSMLILTILCWANLFFIVAGFADSATPRYVIGDARQAISAGADLEQSDQWLKGVEHYEKALKSWPDEEALQLGLRRSKIQFRIDRRYADRSFRASLLSMSRSEALDLFEELAATIQLKYVNQTSLTSVVAHGTESLYYALGNQHFLQTNIAYASTERIRRVRQILAVDGREGGFWNRSIRYHADARATIAHVCDVTQTELGLPAGPVVMEYVFGGCNSLDDYSSFLTPGRREDLYGSIEGKFVGLGIEMKSQVGEGLLLVKVLPGSPAAEGGLQSGEHVVSINGIDCRFVTTDRAAEMLQGTEGSSVSLEVQGLPGTLVRQDTFVRRQVTIKSCPIVRMIDREQGIGYIQMVGFQKSSAHELDEALRQLSRQGMRALIWDLRENPGGLLDSAYQVLDRFIDEGILVSTRGRNPSDNLTYRARRPGTWNIPLVLLVDGNSASASEIVAGAIHDHRRGTLVGRTTYGKWSVQSLLPARLSSGIRLTTAKFYSPDGRNYSKVGIAPDIDVPEPDKRRTYFRPPTDLDVAGDDDLQAGLRILRRQMAKR